MTTLTINNITFYRIANDVNGNPRYVFHYLELADDYTTARKLAKKIGARKHTGKNFGGGFVIQSYSLQHTAKEITKVSQRENAKTFSLTLKQIETLKPEFEGIVVDWSEEIEIIDYDESITALDHVYQVLTLTEDAVNSLKAQGFEAE